MFYKYLKFLILLLPFIFLAVFIENYYENNKNYYICKKKDLEKKLNDIECLILGDSRSEAGIITGDLLLNTFNLSIFGQDVFYSYSLFNKYRDKLPRLKYVILSISDFTMGYEVVRDPGKIAKIYYNRVFDIKNPDREYFSLSLQDFSIFANMGFREAMNKYYEYHCENSNVINYNSLAKYPINMSITKGKKRNIFLNSTYSGDSYFFNLEILKNFYNDCFKSNIKLIILFPPCSNYYRDFGNIERYHKQIEEIESILHTQCNFINLYNSDVFLISDYYDTDHLNYNGAAKLTQIINSSISSNALTD